MVNYLTKQQLSKSQICNDKMLIKRSSATKNLVKLKKRDGDARMCLRTVLEREKKMTSSWSDF